jgi:hypothetical protein
MHTDTATQIDQTNPSASACRRDLPNPLDWPAPIDSEAYHGIAGEAVRAIQEHTESDPAAILIQILVMFGNVIGPSAHFVVEATRHYLNLFTALVGRTAGGRKGTSFNQSLRVVSQIDPEWAASRIMKGLSSGEGLIYNVRDAQEKNEPLKERGRIVDYQPVIVDPGIKDKRLLVVESEFASTLKVLSREGNTLSPVIRQAWDDGSLRTMTKNDPSKATGAHISIIGHITTEELLRHLSETEQSNGFANRFLWVAVRQSKLLPFGGNISEDVLNPIKDRVADAVRFGRDVGAMDFDPQASKMWPSLYYEMAQPCEGIVGRLTARSQAQVRRIACIYALLDKSNVVGSGHLSAAWAVWKYSQASVRFIFDRDQSAHDASAIHDALVMKPSGMTRTELSALFARNKSVGDIEQALSRLAARGLAHKEKVTSTKGRPAERWLAAGAHAD